MKSKQYLRRIVATFVSVVVAFSFAVVVTSSEFTITETYTATAIILDDGSAGGDLWLDAEVKNPSGSVVNNFYEFQFQWQFSQTGVFGLPEESKWSPWSEFSEEMNKPGFYRCAVRYAVIDWGIPNLEVFYTEAVKIIRDPRTTPYTAVIEDYGTLINGRVSLRTSILDRAGEPVDNPGDFLYEWRFTEMQVVREDGEDITVWLPERIVKPESPDPTYIQPPNEIPVSGRYQCFVRYIGDGEPWEDRVMLYTGDANCMVTVVTTAADTTMNTPNRALQNVQPSNANDNFSGVRVRVINGALAFTIHNGFSSTRWVYYNFRLYSVVDGQRYGEPLVSTNRFLESGNGADPIIFDVVLTGRDTFELVYEIRRENGVTATNNGTGTAQNGQNYYAQGRFNFSVTGTTETPAIVGFETTDGENIDIDVGVTINGGAGASLRVDYPIFEPEAADGSGELDIEFPAFSVTYNPNGGVGFLVDMQEYPEYPGLAPNSIILKSGSTYSVRANPNNSEFGFSREDYRFAGWNIHRDESEEGYEYGFYGPGSPNPTINVTENIILYAQWTQSFFPEISFTDQTGIIEDLELILLPSNTQDSGLLSGKSLRIYFKIWDAEIETVTFYYNGFPVTSEDFVYVPEDDVWYFVLDADILEGVLDSEESGNVMTIVGTVMGGMEKYTTIRRIGLFDLY